MLIDAEADLNAQDKYKRTPLHWVAMEGHPELAKGLIDAGADVNAENSAKLTPWGYANSQMREALPELNPTP
jgi:ankyrin repeat protein